MKPLVSILRPVREEVHVAVGFHLDGTLTQSRAWQKSLHTEDGLGNGSNIYSWGLQTMH